MVLTIVNLRHTAVLCPESVLEAGSGTQQAFGARSKVRSLVVPCICEPYPVLRKAAEPSVFDKPESGGWKKRGTLRDILMTPAANSELASPHYREMT